jgi:hypothetical protein
MLGVAEDRLKKDLRLGGFGTYRETSEYRGPSRSERVLTFIIIIT